MAEKTYRRGLILLAAAITGGITGMIYMWSIFNKPLIEANGWTASEVSLAYSLYLLMVCIFGFFNGAIQKRITKPNVIVAIAGAVFGIGWILTGFATSLPMLYFSFSFLVGASNGFIYNTAVSSATKWYPDKRGWANGICIGCMGLAPLIGAPMGNFFIETFGGANAFKICGVIWLGLYLIFAWFLKTPEPGWKPEGWNPPAEQAAATGRNYGAIDMVKTPLYWVLVLLFITAAVSGMLMTGHASGIGQQLAGMTAAEGALMVAILAVANFTGRFGFGALSDKIGRYNTLALIIGINAIVMLFVFANAHTFVTFIIVLCIVGACFGGVMSIVPSTVGDAFGSQNFSQNYSLVYPGYTVASFIGPMVAAWCLDTAGNYDLSFTVAGSFAIAGVILALVAKVLAKRLADK